MPPWRDHASQAPRARAPGWPIGVWLIPGAVVAAGLVGIAAIAGATSEGNGRLDVVPALGSAIERTLQRPVVAGLLAGLLALLLAATVRGARLRWLARRAKTIDVADFTAPEDLSEADARQLTLRFRERLCELHLAAPGPQPGTAPSSDFLQLIGSAAQAQGALGFVTGLLIAAWPRHAYQIQGALMRRQGDRPCGVTIQVLALPSIVSQPTVCWGRTFNDAVDRAANHAAAFILPRTGWVRNPPWRDWKGRAMPPRLVDAYERGSTLAAQGRYDEALREFYDALALDPKNLDVRLRIGFLQEKIGMPLDALATYQALCDLPGVGRRQAKTASIARYRLAVILGSGVELAREWCKQEAARPTERDTERAALRRFLEPTLAYLCEKRIGRTRARSRPGLEALLSDDSRADHRELRLREVFQVTAEHELEKLKRRIRRMPLADPERDLTRTAVALSIQCVLVRLSHTVAELGRKLPDEPAPARDRDFTTLTKRDLQDAAAAAGLRPRPRPTWAERYSAASLYALGITCGAESEAVAELAEAAVAELRKAVAAADTAYVASRRAWLVSEDPDLEGLRATHAFEQFEATCFPGGRPTVRRPRDAHAWERIEYVRGLVRTCAQRREALWLARLDATSDAPSAWWEEERKAWRLVKQVAADCEHRPTRLELIDALRTWGERHGWPRVSLAYPDYADIAPRRLSLDGALAAAHAGLSAVVQRATAETDRCPAPGSPAPEHHDALLQTCRERADAWQRLQSALGPVVTVAAKQAVTDGDGAASLV
jgi:tetratricopeptide (TPR) repeat protein